MLIPQMSPVVISAVPAATSKRHGCVCSWQIFHDIKVLLPSRLLHRRFHLSPNCSLHTYSQPPVCSLTLASNCQRSQHETSMYCFLLLSGIWSDWDLTACSTSDWKECWLLSIYHLLLVLNGNCVVIDDILLLKETSSYKLIFKGSDELSGNEHALKKKPSTGNFAEEHENIIQCMQMQFRSDLGFSGWAMFLHVIFQKKVIVGRELFWKSNFQAWALRKVHYTRLFSSSGITEYLHILNTSTKSIWGLEETGNYFGYTKVFGNQIDLYWK